MDPRKRRNVSEHPEKIRLSSPFRVPVIIDETRLLEMGGSGSLVWKMLTQKCNNFFLPGSTSEVCVKFFVDKYFVGLIHPEFCATLLQYPEVFVKGIDPSSEKPCIRLNPKLKTFSERTNAVEDVMLKLRHCPTFPSLKGWRNEHYGVFVNGRTEALLSIERAASRVLGVNRHNVHITGYTFLNDAVSFTKRQTALPDMLAMDLEEGREPELKLSNVPHNLRVWIARRSLTRPKYPGLLDNLAAGGLTYGLTVMECAKKESMEEAGIPEDLLSSLRPGGCVSFAHDNEDGVAADVDFCFDIELPPHFQPTNVDGEVAEFHLLSLPEVAQLIGCPQFKPTSALVMLDFLVRHGYVSPQDNPLYEKWIQWMHLKLPFD
nr:unnamed protein product [Spirometra erinaceieuropaei]